MHNAARQAIADTLLDHRARGARARIAGGELHTGQAAGGGFLVEATLPAKAQADQEPAG